MIPPARYEAIQKHFSVCRSCCTAVASDLKADVANLARSRCQEKQELGHIDFNPEAVLELMRVYWKSRSLNEMRKHLLEDYRNCIVYKRYKVLYCLDL